MIGRKIKLLKSKGLLCGLWQTRFVATILFLKFPPLLPSQFKKLSLIMVPFFLFFFSDTPPLMDTVCDVLILFLQASPQGASNVLAVN